jgi:predicted glycosyltransferase
MIETSHNASMSATTRGLAASSSGKHIWIDLDNTPHVPFFKPIIRELTRRGHSVRVTARDAFQVCELAREHGLLFKKVGRHYGKSSFFKVWGLGWRAWQLVPNAFFPRPDLALSHGARSQVLVANLLRIPSIMIDDYEHSRYLPLTKPNWFILPEAIPPGVYPHRPDRLLRYSGIKEDVYAPDFKPNAEILRELNITTEELVVTIRPPATEAHYHNIESDRLFAAVMQLVLQTPGAKAVLLPRNRRQELELRKASPEWFAGSRVVVPTKAVDGMNLLWFSDLVISGGGTMNREAAALGVPVYSIFRGKQAAVDQRLQQEGRLTLVKSAEAVPKQIIMKRRDKSGRPDCQSRPALQHIIGHIEEVLAAA